jgi:hypothetical protein
MQENIMSTQSKQSNKRRSRNTIWTTAEMSSQLRSEQDRWMSMRRRPQPSLRARVAAAFRDMGKAVDPKTTHEQTKRFFRSGGTGWAKRLV